MLPLLSQINNMSNSLQAIIMVPTRELAYQCYKVATALNAGGSGQRKDNPIRIERAVGTPVPAMVEAFRHQQPHVLIGTPQLLSQLCFGPEREHIAFPELRTRLKWLVIDEVDYVMLPFSRAFMQRFLDELHSGRRNLE